jgi:hypothetical protein
LCRFSDSEPAGDPDGVAFNSKTVALVSETTSLAGMLPAWMPP